MTDPADSDQLRNTVSSLGATIGKHEELLQVLIEGFQTLAECQDRAFNTLLEQFLGLSVRQPTTNVTLQTVNYAATSCVSPQSTLASQEPCLPSPECYAGNPGSCRAFLSQCSLIFELQTSSFPSQ